MINAIQCLKKPLLSLSCFFSCIWQSHRCEYSINKMNHLLTFNYFLLMIFKQTNQKVLSDNYCCQACQCQVPFTYWQEDLLWQPGYFSSEVAWNYSVLYSVNKTKSALIRIGSDLYDLYGFTHCLKIAFCSGLKNMSSIKINRFLWLAERYSLLIVYILKIFRRRQIALKKFVKRRSDSEIKTELPKQTK